MKREEFSVDCAACPIRHRAVCSRCEPDELAELNKIKFYKTFPAGQAIAIRGEKSDTVASVVNGVATLTRSMEDGRTQLVGLLLPSDFIGRPGRGTIDYDITAVTELTVCCFHKKPFEKMLVDYPHVRERLLEMALDELDAARDWMLLLGRKTARERIASLIALIVKRSTRPDGEVLGDSTRVNLPITRETMANYLGLTIETVSRQLTKLKKDGIIELDGKRGIIIPDLADLLAETGDDDDGGMII